MCAGHMLIKLIKHNLPFIILFLISDSIDTKLNIKNKNVKARKRKISKNLLQERRVNFTVQLPIATGSQI